MVADKNKFFKIFLAPGQKNLFWSSGQEAQAGWLKLAGSRWLVQAGWLAGPAWLWLALPGSSWLWLAQAAWLCLAVSGSGLAQAVPRWLKLAGSRWLAQSG